MALTIHEVKVAAPDELKMGGNNNNHESIRAWWNSVKLYVQSMQELDRATIISYDPDTNDYYLSSVEAE